MNQQKETLQTPRKSAGFAIVLTILASIIGGLLAVYLLLSA
jgi:hypothetical protein